MQSHSTWIRLDRSGQRQGDTLVISQSGSADDQDVLSLLHKGIRGEHR